MEQANHGGNEFEKKFAARPPERHKRVLITGVRLGGMRAAITASAHGHQVILCEKPPSNRYDPARIHHNKW